MRVVALVWLSVAHFTYPKLETTLRRRVKKSRGDSRVQQILDRRGSKLARGSGETSSTLLYRIEEGHGFFDYSRGSLGFRSPPIH